MEKPDRKIILRYALFQIPGIILSSSVAFLLNRWLKMPAWGAWAIIFLWAAKDVAMFFFTWRSYSPVAKDGADAMIGLAGEVTEELSPAGRIHIRGESWSARLPGDHESLTKGASVRVIAVEGLSLFVQPEDEGNVKNVEDCR